MLIFAILILLYLGWTYFMMSSEVNDTILQTPFEVETKKGTVPLHLGMSKDSVIILMGKPDSHDSHSFGRMIVEDLGYNIKGNGYEDLTFHFENGKLESFRQR